MNETREQQVKAAKSYQRITEQWSQEMSIRKTKAMTRGGASQDILFQNEAFQAVTEFAYLGSVIHESGSDNAETNSRISKARGALAKGLVPQANLEEDENLRV